MSSRLRLVRTLAENATGTGMGPVIHFPRSSDKLLNIFMERTSGTGTINSSLQGRMTSADAWETVFGPMRHTDLNADNVYAAFRIAKFPQMRINYIVQAGTTVTWRTDG